MSDPLTVLCPTCLARPGSPCKSVVSWFQGIEHGQGSVIKALHNARKARASGLKVVKEEPKS